MKTTQPKQKMRCIGENGLDLAWDRVQKTAKKQKTGKKKQKKKREGTLEKAKKSESM